MNQNKVFTNNNYSANFIKSTNTDSKLLAEINGLVRQTHITEFYKLKNNAVITLSESAVILDEYDNIYKIFKDASENQNQNQKNTDDLIRISMEKIERGKDRIEDARIIVKNLITKIQESQTANKESPTAKSEAETANKESQTTKSEAETANKESQTAESETETAKRELEEVKRELEEAKSEAETAKRELVEAKKEIASLQMNIDSLGCLKMFIKSDGYD